MYADGIAFSEGWNFGPGDDGVMDVENVVKSVIEAWGSGNYQIAHDADYHEAHLLKLDISKAKALLKWAPRQTTYAAIEKSIDVYKLFGQNSREIKPVVESQIDFFTRP